MLKPLEPIAATVLDAMYADKMDPHVAITEERRIVNLDLRYLYGDSAFNILIARNLVQTDPHTLYCLTRKGIWLARWRRSKKLKSICSSSC
jgi:hypothetical protein